MSPNLYPLRKCLAVAASLLLLISAFASDKRPEADYLMSRAAELSSLDHKDSRPFHLYVNFMLAGMVSGSTDGRYLWTSVPNQHWRQEIKFADYSQVAIGEHGKIWLKRTTEFQPKPVTWLSTLLGNYARLKLLSDEKVTRVYNDSHTRCVELDRQGDGVRVFCFNSDGTLNRVQMPAENATYSYSDYEKFGDKLFPRKMRLIDHGRLVVDAIVDDLAWENEPYPGLFTPPSGAVENPGCAHPSPGKAIKTTQPDYPLQARQQQRGGAVTLATRIQPDGSVQVLTVTETAGRDLDEAAARAVRQWKFSPYMCGDTPVPVETDITVAFRIQR